MKKPMLLVIALLALSSVMAAFAFTSATIDNDATLSVVSSDESLIALMPYTEEDEVAGVKDGFAYIDGGKLKIDLSKGLGGEGFGVQPNSTFEWGNLFKVRNNSEETIEFNITKEGWGFDTKVNIYLQGQNITADNADVQEFYWRSNTRNGKVTLAPGEEANISLSLETEGGAQLIEREAELTVNATVK
ncbi:DUF1102 domain-containing protein [Chengkuizengella axinellae]|uniref:DUF1102 domain-containing protein n=1 Tax=Chengkuizengella axinellae TaxID=3064388 RepID=A0ABT9IUK8_9BACL|nr:DUF1102 domain-containing protein [Chengkuizengella sp. 2205SS18-9]MDP5272992.1 DUF1102 domain-containing protein [Chengkuizengella sp. 2205SS18-9]